MNIDGDLQALVMQETALTFHHATAWELGTARRAAAEQHHPGRPIPVMIQSSLRLKQLDIPL